MGASALGDSEAGTELAESICSDCFVALLVRQPVRESATTARIAMKDGVLRIPTKYQMEMRGRFLWDESKGKCRFLRQAQDRLFDCVSHDGAVRHFAQDDTFLGVLLGALFCRVVVWVVEGE